MEPAALLHEGDSDEVIELLLRDVLADGTSRRPDVLEPFAHVLVGGAGQRRAAGVGAAGVHGMIPADKVVVVRS